MSTGAMVSVPSAMAATACTPPSTKISSAPPKCIAATMAGCGPPRNGGAHAMMRFTPATSAGAIDMCGDVAMAGDPAGQRLDLEVAHGFLLLLREVAHLALRELDVLEVALANLRDRLVDFLVGQAEALRL